MSVDVTANRAGDLIGGLDHAYLWVSYIIDRQGDDNEPVAVCVSNDQETALSVARDALAHDMKRAGFNDAQVSEAVKAGGNDRWIIGADMASYRSGVSQ